MMLCAVVRSRRHAAIMGLTPSKNSIYKCTFYVYVNTIFPKGYPAFLVKNASTGRPLSREYRSEMELPQVWDTACQHVRHLRHLPFISMASSRHSASAALSGTFRSTAVVLLATWSLCGCRFIAQGKGWMQAKAIVTGTVEKVVVVPGAS